MQRLLRLARENGVLRSKEVVRHRVHRQYIRVACERGLLKQIGRGLYAEPGWNSRHGALIATCKRIPTAVICLQSALYFHGLSDTEPRRVRVAIDRKAWKPQSKIPMRVARFSGEALTKGVMNLRLGNSLVRIYSPMKTLADCFKYRRKIGIHVGVAALESAIKEGKYNRQKLFQFARICRVTKIVAAYADAAEKHVKDCVRREPDVANSGWSREVLRQQVWSKPLKQIAKQYGVSDVAIAKRCRKMNIPLPGRGYWAKQTSTIFKR